MDNINTTDPQLVEHLQPLPIDEIPDADKKSLAPVGLHNHILTRNGDVWNKQTQKFLTTNQTFIQPTYLGKHFKFSIAQLLAKNVRN